MWEIILAQVIGIPFLIAAVAWLCKSIITHRLNKDLEIFINTLESQNEIQLEKLRNQLQLNAIEHEIRFRSIHEKQAEAIAKTYALLIDANAKINSYVGSLELTSEPSKKEKYEIAYESYENFRNYFYPRAIYFSKNLGIKVSDIGNGLAKIVSDFTRGLQREQAGSGDRGKNYKDNFWERAEKAAKELKPILRDMATEFRQILGVKDATGADNGEEETGKETG